MKYVLAGHPSYSSSSSSDKCPLGEGSRLVLQGHGTVVQYAVVKLAEGVKSMKARTAQSSDVI